METDHDYRRHSRKNRKNSILESALVCEIFKNRKKFLFFVRGRKNSQVIRNIILLNNKNLLLTNYFKLSSTVNLDLKLHKIIFKYLKP